jgi:hypothetical protein
MNNPALLSVWEMLTNYLPLYNIVQLLQALQSEALILRTVSQKITESRTKQFNGLLNAIVRDCPAYGLKHSAELAKRAMARPMPDTYVELTSVLTHLDDSLASELEKQAMFRIPPERKEYFERDDLFGSEVATAFPSCVRDIQKAGSCYALGQEDACVHHLMLVLERGLKALSIKVSGTYQQTNWQSVINNITGQLKNMPAGPQREFYKEVNAQFGFLKDAYRNHSQHAHDDPYDLEKALSILNHVRRFMQEVAKGGLAE